MRKDGFTLIEVLVALGIISVLFAFIVGICIGNPGPEEGTRAILMKLDMALGSYYNEFRAYPPDGYDFPVYAPNGLRLEGSACLAYFLGWAFPDGSGGYMEKPLKKKDLNSTSGGLITANNSVPYWSDFKPGKDLGPDGKITDLFKVPIQYDNCADSISIINYEKNLDPRTALNSGNSFNRDYDLWSYGRDSSGDEPGPNDDIIMGFEHRR